MPPTVYFNCFMKSENQKMTNILIFEILDQTKPPDMTTERYLTSPEEAEPLAWFLRRVESKNCFSTFRA